MAQIPIDKYSVTWDPEASKGEVFVQRGNNKPTQLPVETAPEFIALMLLLSKPGVLFDTASKKLYIGLRPIGT